MTVYFVNIGKTGTSAIRNAIRRIGKGHPTPYGPINFHRHHFKLMDVPEEDYVFFTVRDPVARYVSAFYSRLRKGAPRYHYEWTERERVAFEQFPTPQALAEALASSGEQRAAAEQAMKGIRHVNRPLTWWLRSGRYVKKRASHIVHVAYQETLTDDWEQIKTKLHLPAHVQLPKDPVKAHRSDPSLDRTLSPRAEAALRDWYRKDYDLLRVCDKIRAGQLRVADSAAAVEGRAGR